MPDFTIIEGGGKGQQSFKEFVARKAFRQLMIELFRDLGRSNGGGFETTRALIEFVDYAHASNVSIGPLIGEVISEFRSAAFMKIT